MVRLASNIGMRELILAGLPSNVERSSASLVTLVYEAENFLLAHELVFALERARNVSNLACVHCWEETGLV